MIKIMKYLKCHLKNRHNENEKKNHIKFKIMFKKKKKTFVEQIMIAV